MATNLEEDESLEIPKVITTLSTLLQRDVDSNDSCLSSAGDGGGGGDPSPFRGAKKPAISIRSYSERIFRYARCSPSCFVVAYVYLDRFARRRPGVAVVGSLTVHRLLLTAVMVAAKFLDDIYCNNAYFAKVGGISRREMNLLEINFLFGIQFDLNVTPKVFNSYCSILQSESPATLLRLCCFSSEEDPANYKQKQLIAS